MRMLVLMHHMQTYRLSARICFLSIGGTHTAAGTVHIDEDKTDEWRVIKHVIIQAEVRAY